eukprot:TRINITY_DN1790_c0_g1_i2.p1 TRINITY_DN1790_c0_g1~~TRINITY_DN1790_c0_g1_i2.p1  ORF type:complete len:534 (-),score=65.39 TRINITY_DN1790_c0_g1_i2:2897-4498(-)
MSGQVDVGTSSQQANESNISQTVMDQFLSNNMMQMNNANVVSSSAMGAAAGNQRGRDYNLPPPGCDPDTIKLFVGSIPPKYTQEILRPYFSQIGEVVEISVLEGRGSGFIWYRTRAEAERAIRELDGKKPGIDPKEEHRPLEIRQARLKTEPFGMPQNSNLPNAMQLMGMMQNPAGANFQNIFQSMNNNPTLIIQFIDVMLQQHTQQTQFLQQIRDAVCQINNLGPSNFNSQAMQSPATSPFGSGPPTAPSLNAFGLNATGNNSNVRRSVDNHLFHDRSAWHKDALSNQVPKRTSLDFSSRQDNNSMNSVNNNPVSLLNNHANSTPIMNQNQNAALMNMLLGGQMTSMPVPDLSNFMNMNTLNNSNNNGFSPSQVGPSPNNTQGGLDQLLQAFSGNNGGLPDLAKMQALLQSSGVGGGLPNLGDALGDQQALLATLLGQNGGLGNLNMNMVSSAMNGNMGDVSNVSRGMDVMSQSNMNADVEAKNMNNQNQGDGRMLRQILENGVADGSRENSMPAYTQGHPVRDEQVSRSQR